MAAKVVQHCFQPLPIFGTAQSLERAPDQPAAQVGKFIEQIGGQGVELACLASLADQSQGVIGSGHDDGTGQLVATQGAMVDGAPLDFVAVAAPFSCLSTQLAYPVANSTEADRKSTRLNSSHVA